MVVFLAGQAGLLTGIWLQNFCPEFHCFSLPEPVFPISSPRGKDFAKTKSHFFFVFLPFLGLILWHMEVPRLGVESALTTGLRQSHSNEGSKPRLQPTPQLTAMLDP